MRLEAKRTFTIRGTTASFHILRLSSMASLENKVQVWPAGMVVLSADMALFANLIAQPSTLAWLMSLL
jgi:hypothetical protein